MYVEFLAPSPKAGQREHVSRETGDALIVAGFARAVELPPASIKPPSFGIWRGQLSDTIALKFHCEACQRTEYFGGSATDANFADIEKKLCIHAKGGVPKAYREAYAQAVEGRVAPSADVSATMAIRAAGGRITPEPQFRIHPQTGEKVPV